jgi:adenine-specific DNA-methyltransferase
MVQLPEPLEEVRKLESGRLLRTIADVGKQRVRRVLEEFNAGDNGSLGIGRDGNEDRGFRVFNLTASNFKIWDATSVASDAEQLGQQLKLFADHVLQERTEQSILYELILKAGLPMTAKIETKTVADNAVYSIAEGMLLICLANPITQECLRGMMELQPQRVVCLDPAFQGNDQLKTNTVLEMKTHGIEFRTV